MFVGIALTSLLSCSALAPSPSRRLDLVHFGPRLENRVEHVLLVVFDGVRREDALERPLAMPHLTDLERRGASLGAPGVGADFDASGPNFISLPGYMEIFTARPPVCQENDCTEPPTFTLLDAVCDAATGGPCNAAVFSSWPNIERVVAANPGRATVSSGKHIVTASARIEQDPTLYAMHQAGESANASPGSEDYRADSWTSALALAYIAKHEPRFSFVSLGDTDEYAHAGDRDSYLAALSRADAFIGALTALADAWEKRGERTVIAVTTDHGRGANFHSHGQDHPESAHSWLVIAGGPIRSLGKVALSRTRHLRDLAPTLSALLDVPFADAPDLGSPLEEVLR